MASQKHKTLTLEDKVIIIKLIKSGHSYDAISKTFGIGKSTVGDIKKIKDGTMRFVSITESGTKVRKTMKTADNVALENAVYLWFIQQRRLHVPISGEMICEKALFFHRQMTESDQGFVASKGWLDRFKHRHGIRRLKITGEKLSSNESAIESFRIDLANCWASVSTLLINKSWKNLLPNYFDSEVEENVQTEEIQLAPLINQLQNSNPISNPEALQWAAEAEDSLALNKILADDEIIRTVTAEDDVDDDDTPVNSVKISHSEAVVALNTSLQWAE
ncbi:hypothetical protein J437_LFUL005228 [Ladona fulva]|uniref:HTH CENPB-type domain-containing protein n=1 Tax=Ladona fulva TaxID=123851 RepID=A0A8K0P2Z2_LADFU|nr:hypothetical protein J437_LFUL005228 [Ladona fulva]